MPFYQRHCNVHICMCIAVDYRAIFRPFTLEKFHVYASLNRNVGLLRIFPSMTTHLVRAFLQPPIEGVVLQSYGAGNVPTNREDIIKELSAATKRGVIIVNITQCATGCVKNSYAPGKLLEEAGTLKIMLKIARFAATIAADLNAKV